jgi:hypothetical protein
VIVLRWPRRLASGPRLSPGAEGVRPPIRSGARLIEGVSARIRRDSSSVPAPWVVAKPGGARPRRCAVCVPPCRTLELAQPVAAPGDVEHVAAVEQAVEDRGREHLVAGEHG